MNTNDYRNINPYQVAAKYREVALDRLANDRGLLSPAYRKLLESQILACDKEMEKKARPDSILWKRFNSF